MIEVPEAFTHYLAAWNEKDVTKIRAHFKRSCVENVLFVDPTITTNNIDELTAFAIKLRNEKPTTTNHLLSGVDGHNGRYRYLWEIYEHGKLLLQGMDMVTIDEEGKIIQIDGFYGPFPTLKVK